MDNTSSSYEELLLHVLLFLDNPTLKNAIKLDKKWQCLIGKNSHTMIGPWVKTYLRHNFFKPENKKTNAIEKHAPKPTAYLVKNLLPENSMNNSGNTLTSSLFLELSLKNPHTKTISIAHLLAYAIIPTTAFIIAESLTEDFEASLYATLMMFGIGIPALLLGNFFGSYHVDGMPLQLMNMLMLQMEKKRRRKLEEKVETEPSPIQPNPFEYFTPKPISIRFKAKF